VVEVDRIWVDPHCALVRRGVHGERDGAVEGGADYLRLL
jgi:hypothetical protein